MEKHLKEQLYNISISLGNLSKKPYNLDEIFYSLVNGLALPFSFITVEDLIYTPDQQERLEQLRQKNLVEIQIKESNLKSPSYAPLGVEDPVFIIINGVSFSGYIVKIITSREKYIVSTPHGEMTVSREQIKKRYVEDYSNVTIPEVLKKMRTKELLRQLSYTGEYRYDDNEYWVKSYGQDELRAELANREHIPSKREIKTVKKYLASKKKKNAIKE